MRRGLLLSLLIHILVIGLTDISLSDFLPKNEEVKAIKVRLVSPQAEKVNVKKAAQPKKRSQQSEAPKEPPKKKEQPKPKPEKRETKVVQQKAIKQKEEKPKEQPKEQKKDKIQTAKEEVKSPISRPEKLDKSKKKEEIKTDNPKAEVAETPDDFLEALAFAEKLEEKQTALVEGVETETDTVITAEEEAEILIIKRHIEKNWYRPSGIKDIDKMTMHVELRLNRDGTLASMRMLKSSGQRFLDDSLERAVRKAQPLPIPGDKYDTFKVIDLHFNG